jgi:hypothetical protein
LTETIQELESRGIVFDRPISTEPAGWQVASFRTPHGLSIDLVGQIEPAEISRESPAELPSADLPDTKQMSPGEYNADEVEDSVEVEPVSLGSDHGIDAVDLVTRQNQEAPPENALLPFLRTTPGRRERLSNRPGRGKTTNRFNDLNLSDLKRMPARGEQPNHVTSRPRTNGEVTYVEIEDEDDPQG